MNSQNETVDNCLASFSPRRGQGVLIEAGVVHALGDGVVVFEVQENSDVTFRLYDWEHVDPKTGRPRPCRLRKRWLASIWSKDRSLRSSLWLRLRDL